MLLELHCTENTVLAKQMFYWLQNTTKSTVANT